jgi:hypothetical protein
MTETTPNAIDAFPKIDVGVAVVAAHVPPKLQLAATGIPPGDRGTRSS